MVSTLNLSGMFLKVDDSICMEPLLWILKYPRNGYTTCFLIDSEVKARGQDL